MIWRRNAELRSRSCSRFRRSRDVFDRRDPSALRQRLVDDLKRTPVRAFHHGVGDFSRRDVAQDVRTEFLDVAVERSGVLAMLDQVVEVAARLHDVCRQIVHIEIALVGGDDACRRVIQHEALRHVVQGGIEPVLFRFQPLLRFPVLPGHLPDDQEQDEGDHQRRQHGGSDQESGLRAPVGQRRRDRRGRDHHDWKAAQPARPIRAGPAWSMGLCTRRVCCPPSVSTLCSSGAALNFFPIIEST